MIIQDLINGCFEGAAGILLWFNVVKIRKDRNVRGIFIFPTVVFTAWGFWNLAYYPWLNQMISFYAGISVVLANVTWVAHALYYHRQDKK